MKIKFQIMLKVNYKNILKDCILLVSEAEIKQEVQSIVQFWAEQRLKEEGWPLPNSNTDIREYLLVNELIREKSEED